MIEFKCPICEKRVEAGVGTCPTCGLSSSQFVELYSDTYSSSVAKKQGGKGNDLFVEYCVKCGSGNNSTNNSYCSKCGNSLDAQRQTTKSEISKGVGINRLEQVENPKYKLKSLFILAGILVTAILLIGIIFNDGGLGSSVTHLTKSTSNESTNSNAYDIGVSQAQSFIDGGGLTRAKYDALGGADASCQFILATFMGLAGGSSTDQQYSDFISGCLEVIKKWS
jgi:hypothetical protein